MRSCFLAVFAVVGCSSAAGVQDAAIPDAGHVDRDDVLADVVSETSTDAGADAGVAIDRGGSIPCTAGRIESCPCTGGGAGAQTCGADGVYGPCVCFTSDATVTDATVTDASVDDAPLAGDEYCRAVGIGTTCAGASVNTCGVCVTTSPRRDVLERTNCDATLRHEYCRSGTVGAPDLQCFLPGSYPTVGASERVTMWGYVRVAGNGGDSQHIRISVHRVNEDGTPGEMLGTAVSNIANPASGMEDVYSPSRDRVLFTRRTGGYQIPNVPTETELLVITEGDPADAESAGLWSHRVYTYDVVLLNADVGAVMPPGGIAGARTVRFLPGVFSNSDWMAVPASSTLTAGITRGRAMLIGEVHDCADVRLANATVDSAPRRAWDGPVVYFSENDTNPLPALSRDRTSLLGMYALLDVDPGLVRVAAVGRDASGALLHLGSRRVRTFADAVTYVTLRGLRPWQVSVVSGTDAGGRP